MHAMKFALFAFDFVDEEFLARMILEADTKPFEQEDLRTAFLLVNLREYMFDPCLGDEIGHCSPRYRRYWPYQEGT